MLMVTIITTSLLTGSSAVFGIILLRRIPRSLVYSAEAAAKAGLREASLIVAAAVTMIARGVL